MKQTIHKFILFVIALFISTTIAASEVKNPYDDAPTTREKLGEEIKSNLKVISAKAKPSLSGINNSAAYVTLRNDNDFNLAIIRAIGRTGPKPNSSPVANRVEMHIIATDDKGVSKMVPVNRLVIPAKSELEMKPGGIHIMLIDLKKRLEYGDKIYVDFIVEQAGNFIVEVPVGNI